MNPTTTAQVPILTRVATYERVSSEDQRQRETIKSQTEALAVRLAHDPSVELVHRYVDDGISGKTPLCERPGGRQLLADARAGLFEELWVYRVDRLGRDWVDPQVVWDELCRSGVTIFSVYEGRLSRFMFTIHVGLAAQERETTLGRTGLGMDRAAREGRYCGGVIAMGYRLEGTRPNARLVPDETLVWADLSAAAVVIRIYEHLAIDKWSCRRIAAEFNALGIPTAAKRPGQGKRWKKTQGIWRAGRIRNLVVNPIYRGEIQYGRRKDTKQRAVHQRGVISAHVPELALVSDELWQAALETLAENRLMPKNTNRVYLLRSVMVCGTCGLTYIGSQGNGADWYRCNGYLTERGSIEGRCRSKAVKGVYIEPQIWADIEAFLRSPGELLAELEREAETDTGADAEREQRATLHAALDDLAQQRTRLLDLAQSGFLEKDELRVRLDALAAKHTALEERLSALEPAPEAPEDPGAPETLDRLRARLDEGLTHEERAEIVRILVRRIVIHNETDEDGKKKARAVVEYRLPEPTEGDVSVVPSSTVRDSWPRSE